MTKFITVTSGKGGVGKTTTAINLGFALNSFGKEVVIVDANLTTPNVGLHLGAPIVPINLNHVLSGRAKVSDALYQHDSGTKIIPSSLSVKELKKIPNGKLKDVAKKLRRTADYVFFDSAAGLGDEAVDSMEAADELIVVTNPEITAVTDALKAIKLAEQMDKEVRGVIVTRVSGAKGEMPLANIKDMLGVPVLGVVPEDSNVRMALTNKNALIDYSPHSRASRAYRKIAAKIASIDVRDHYKAPFFTRLFGR